MTWTDDEYNILLPLCCQQVEVGIDKGQAWTSAPMAKQSRLDVIELKVAFEECIIT